MRDMIAAMETPSPNRRFRFSRRALLVLVVLLAIPCSWLIAKIWDVKREEAAAAAIIASGGDVEWDRDAAGPAWLHGVFGDHFFGHVIDVKFKGEAATDDAVRHLDAMNHLQDLGLESTRITVAGLMRFRGLHKLKAILLCNMDVNEAWLDEIGKLDQLEWVSLVGTHATDVGLAKLTGIKNLKTLFLYERNITDAGLEYVAKLKQLTEANIGGTRATPEGVEKLRQALPNCQIRYFP
jgi:hypothetical protein